MERSGDSSFAYKNEMLHCENVALNAIEEQLGKTEEGILSTTPLYVYSKKQLLDNIQGYQNAIRDCGMGGRVRVFYAVKANANVNLLTIVRDANCGAVTVSGFELQLALDAGFDSNNILLNGNGKQIWEIDLALTNNCMLNIDSLFDAENIVESARRLKKTARVLLRINPGLEHSSTPVHKYLATALKDSKFGIPLDQLDAVINLVNEQKDWIKLIGLHCHVGSTIRDASIYSEIVRLLSEMASKLKLQGHPMTHLNIGGGLAIDYLHQEDECKKISTKNNLIAAAASSLPADLDLIIEPGRSIMATTGVLVAKVLGLKQRPNHKNFLIVDAAMNDLIRPSFYEAYHHILPLNRRNESSTMECDVVGPVCESGDFLAKNRILQRLQKGDYIAVMDVGAYGMAMASSYNMRGRATEVLVDGDDWKIIRRRETFATLIQSMTGL